MQIFIAWCQHLNLIFFLLLLSFAFSNNCFAKIYTWQDENGITHYSDHEVINVEASEISVKTKESNWQQFIIKIEDFDASLTINEQKRIENDVNAVYQFFDQKLFFDIYKTVPVNIKLLGNRQQYQAYINAHSKIHHSHKAQIMTSSLGVYIPSLNEIVAFVQDDREDTFRTIKHETSHAVVDTLIPYAPSWLNEGLAENMESIYMEGDELYLIENIKDYKVLPRLHKEKRLLAVDEFISLRNAKWREQNAKSRFALQVQAAELSRLLLSSKSGRSFLSGLMHNYERGNTEMSIFLIDDKYLGGINTLKNKWSLWMFRDDAGTIKL